MRRRYSTYRDQNRKSKKILKVIKYIFFLFILYTFVSVFLISSYIMNSSSMEPALKEGQRILATPVVFGGRIFGTSMKAPGFRTPGRGEIVVISRNQSPVLRTLLDSIVRFFTLQRKTLFNSEKDIWKGPVAVKRIIGIPGDVVKIENYTAYIKTPDSSSFVCEKDLILKKYKPEKGILPVEWKENMPFSGTMEAVKLGDNEYFVLNDNRTDVNDSRLFGPLPVSSVKAPVFLSYLPGFSFK